MNNISQLHGVHKMTISTKEFTACLAKNALDSRMSATLLGWLRDANLIADDDASTISASASSLTKLKTPLEAATESQAHFNAIRRVQAECSRLGFNFKLDQPIDEAEMNAAFSKHTSAGDIERRIEIKGQLFGLGLIAK
jgi:hypothetical protein